MGFSCVLGKCHGPGMCPVPRLPLPGVPKQRVHMTGSHPLLSAHTENFHLHSFSPFFKCVWTFLGRRLYCQDDFRPQVVALWPPSAHPSIPFLLAQVCPGCVCVGLSWAPGNAGDPSVSGKEGSLSCQNGWGASRPPGALPHLDVRQASNPSSQASMAQGTITLMLPAATGRLPGSVAGAGGGFGSPGEAWTGPRWKPRPCSSGPGVLSTAEGGELITEPRL